MHRPMKMEIAKYGEPVKTPIQEMLSSQTTDAFVIQTYARVGRDVVNLEQQFHSWHAKTGHHGPQLARIQTRYDRMRCKFSQRTDDVLILMDG